MKNWKREKPPEVKRFVGVIRRLLKMRQELGFKLFLIAASIALASVVFSSLLVLSFQRKQIVEDNLEATNRLSGVIKAGLEYAMLRNDRELINQIIKNQVETQYLNRIRILDDHGLVQASSNPGDIGQVQDHNSPSCRLCHDRLEGQTGLLTQIEGQDMLLNVNLIYNQDECQACHPAQDGLLGLLVIEKPVSDLNSELLRAFWRISAAGLFTFCLLLFLLLWTSSRLVLKPVTALNQGVAAITAGELDQKIEVTRKDELGRLAAAFDSMRVQLKTSRSEMKQRNQELALLNDIALNASQMFDPQQIMDLALDTVVDRLGMQSGFIRLFDEETGRFTLRASRGVSQELCERIERRRLETGLDISQQAVETGQVIFLPDMSTEMVFREVWGETSQRSHVIIPLMSRGDAIGTLVLVTYPARPLRLENLEILQAVGHEIGIAIDNALLLQETQEREQEARGLYQLAVEISGSLELNQVLQAVAKGARALMSADLGLVGLRDEDREEIIFAAADGGRADGLHGLRFAMNEKWQNSCLKSGCGVNIQDLTEDQELYDVRDSLSAAGVVSCLAMSLCRGSNFQGLILVASRQPRHFLQKEIQRMDRLARHIFDAVENARLYQKVGYLATLEERERLAREMHDRLAQALGYINLKTAITEGQLQENQVAQARSSLQELKQISQSTYTDVRESIFNLRAVLATGLRFLPTLEEYVRDYRIHYGLDVRLAMDGVDLSRFPPDVDIQLLRIIQEALTNVRKHAQASQVWIHFLNEQGRVKIMIEDDGLGFDPRSISVEGDRSFGLQIMRERARCVGGALELEANPGQGTRVVLWMPYEHDGRRNA